MAIATPDDLSSFVVSGARILESVAGDLTGEGDAGVLLVIDAPLTGAERLGEGYWREIALLLWDDAGQLYRASTNTRLVPSALCGGLAGDPYAYSTVAKGKFTIVVSGGSREIWTDEFTFAYVSDKKDWFVCRVTRRVVDTDTDQTRRLDLRTGEMGSVAFADFDPRHLPEVAPA